MKGSRWFIIFIAAFLFIMFAIEYHLPKNFVWKPTFGHYDEQPFGCAIFDSLLSSSLPQGYTFSKKSLYQLEQEDTTQRRGILVISDNLRLSDVDVNALLKMAERGDKIMLVSTLFGRYMEDTLSFRSYYSYFSPMALKKYATSFLLKDSLCWVGDSAVYPRQTFYFYPQLCSSYFWGDSLPERVLAQKVLESNEFKYETEADSLVTDSVTYMPVAMSRQWGKGEVILVSTPLIFTNYGILVGKNAIYIFRSVVTDGKTAHSSYRGIHEGDGTGAAIAFPLSFGTPAASLGVVSDNDYHHTLHDIYCEETATGYPCYSGTGQ